MKFTHLHAHSHYSLLDGLSKIDELLDYVKEKGMDSVALTDHGVLYGVVEFYKKAKKRGIKPIIGSELYQAFERMHLKRPNIDNKRYHLVVLAKNEKGYKNLVHLVSQSHLKGFYYKPRIDEKLLKKHAEGLIGLSACLEGKIPQLILAGKTKEAKTQAKKYQEIFGKGNFYLEIQDHPNIKEQKKINKALIKFSKKLDIPLVATNDSHYLKPEDAKIQDILMLINTGADPNDPERLTMQADDFSLRTPEQMKKSFKNVPEALQNTQKIAEKCNFSFKLGEVKLPHFEVPNNKSSNQYLEELCKEGLKKRYGENPKKEVKERLKYELSAIKDLGFSSYFLIVQDFVNWAKENHIVVGPGRGSAAGSLVSYLLNITDVDPIKYNLLFERFLNPGRKGSLPDIDLDFTDRRRDEVIEYVSQKYGKDKVAQIITFGTMKARAVIRDAGRAMSYSYNYCDKIAKMIPFGFDLEKALKKVPEFKQIYDTDQKAERLIEIAKKLEGRVRHASTHACGVVISKEPLQNSVPLQHPPQSDKEIVTQYEMHAIEDLGLLKMDLLGLKNLTIIEDCLARIYEVQGKSIDIGDIPLDDKKAFGLLQRGETTGVFQMESGGFRRYLKQLKPTCFEDITAMVALYRPGPISLIPDYIKRKNKKKKVKYLHPKLKPILESTYGIMVYQEQLMEIAQKLAGFSLSEADILRKAVGKKIKSLLISQKEKFINGMIENKFKRQTAEKIWEWILPFAQYGFNKSHSTSYGMIAYQTAYLKAHFPIEFMAALLTSEKSDIDRISILIKECEKMEIEVLPPDINESFRNFSVVPKEKKIRFGLLAIKNVGKNTVETIISKRKKGGDFKSIYNFISRINSQSLNKRSLESLIKTGAFDKLEERNKLLFNLETILEANREIRKNKNNGQVSLFKKSSSFQPSLKLKNPPKPASESEKTKWEKQLLGLYISSHPLENYEKILNKKSLSLKEINKNLVGKNVKIGGIISNTKRILTKNGNPMLFLTLEDLTDRIEVIVFPSALQKNADLFQEENIVLIKGKVNNRDGSPKIICNEIQKIVEES